MPRFSLRGLPSALRRVRESDFHLVRTAQGWAAVYTVASPDGDPMRVLDVGGAYQSATYLGKRRFEPVFAYYRASDAAFATAAPVRRALMIGGGGCAWPKHAAAQHADLAVDVVEADPLIIAIARRFFFVDELEAGPRKIADTGTLRLEAADGRAFLRRSARTYDAILNDAFVGTEPAWSLATVEAAQDIARRLSPAGAYLTNVVSKDGGRDIGFLRDVAATLGAVFPHVQVVPSVDEGFSAEDNYLVSASFEPLRIPGAFHADQEFSGNVITDAQVGAAGRKRA